MKQLKCPTCGFEVSGNACGDPQSTELLYTYDLSRWMSAGCHDRADSPGSCRHFVSATRDGTLNKDEPDAE